ncbi:hypothetical protein [Streptomyces sp. NPDC005955]|uniref:hypothetical protein n=1 Tax=Streptomyces sp. NPDC005955 TaxID=3364738 RepID=UPI0036A03B40
MVGARLADRQGAATEPDRALSPSGSDGRATVVDGRALKGSARRTATRRKPLAAVAHGISV